MLLHVAKFHVRHHLRLFNALANRITTLPLLPVIQSLLPKPLLQALPYHAEDQHSDNKHRITDTSAIARLPISSRPPQQNHSKINDHSFHPYRQPSSSQEHHFFDRMLGSSNSDNLSEDTSSGKLNDAFLTHLDRLGPRAFRMVVHLKEAVRERQRMRLFTTYWELEESARQNTLCDFLYREAQVEFAQAEQESRVMLEALLEKHPLSVGVADTQYLTTICVHNKASLHQTDAQLDLLKDRVESIGMTRLSFDDSINNTKCCQGPPC
ncbi:hypothetical protein EV702DRAFT_1199894 [Suillus placidus]|uniref:Uncharacterized protein n=1 Tax=Suillus placidus TaxID=48579 RepID=A0A9P7D0N3_9AGAM|nr:hypothetical protein EV702DRAFT_1199894 [Suillus placidus]